MKIFENITFSSQPMVLAAWPGMGNVGLIAVDYLRNKLHAKPFAELDMSPFFIPDSIVVKNGIAQFPELPTSLFYYTKYPDLIIFESNAQVGGRDGIAVIRKILDVIAPYGVDRIFTFAAFAQPVSYREPSRVFITCNGEPLMQKLSPFGVLPMPDGDIAGLNGLLLGVAASRRIEAGCLLGTIPSYAMNFAYPKASLALIRTISQIQDISINTDDLTEGVEEMDQQLATIEDRIREFFPSVNKGPDDEMAALDEEKVPHYVMDKIELLFLEAKHDREKAAELKKELDRWNLYELYENRFLDLFDEEKNE